MLKKMMVIGLAVSSITTIGVTKSTQAIETGYYYDGETQSNLYAGGMLAKQIPNTSLGEKPAGHSNTSKYKAVGYIKNLYSSNGGSMMGTGVVIDDYTILTNAHVIDKVGFTATSPKNLTFQMNRDGPYVPYSFAVKKIYKIKGADLALLYTYKKLSNSVQPMGFASETYINSLKKGTPLYSVAYPYYKSYWGTKRYWYRSYFLRNTTNGKELMMKDKIRGGNSGSPLVNSKYQIVGIRTYGERVDGYDENKWAKYELGGSFAIKGNVRKLIFKYKY
ncbi:trypsin-like serine peptidase [Macrococcus capreoli]|uniref:trypsin-like serine peptidase n=1 Tax=Macrococcus capreoli TaxID=2982690 RepID=UPI0021D579A3|nr:serine protease [Macrococcus sp. TMW 2.2395]MCU7558579.1 serine protease [Macrococcus sp. TMW 2.2395]